MAARWQVFFPSWVPSGLTGSPSVMDAIADGCDILVDWYGRKYSISPCTGVSRWGLATNPLGSILTSQEPLPQAEVPPRTTCLSAGAAQLVWSQWGPCWSFLPSTAAPADCKPELAAFQTLLLRGNRTSVSEQNLCAVRPSLLSSNGLGGQGWDPDLGKQVWRLRTQAFGQRSDFPDSNTSPRIE